MSNNLTQIEKFFEMGFEEIEAVDLEPRTNKYLYHKEDFAEGGKMERFAKYTRERFEREFACILSFR